MGQAPQLEWLPADERWRERLKDLARVEGDEGRWEALVRLANSRLDFVLTNMLDKALRRSFPDEPPRGLQTKPVRLALLGSATMAHLHGAIRVAGLRRNLRIDIYENAYGQYLQELTDRGSSLYAFKPNTILLALDAHHLTEGFGAGLSEHEAHTKVEEIIAEITGCWTLAQQSFACSVLHQSVLNARVPLMGGNEHRLPGSPQWAVHRLNRALREAADKAGVDLLGLDLRAERDGLSAWYDSALWHRSKQEVTPAASPMYGDLLVRVLAAKQGRSAKCLVLDLDNTLWGGVIGDDGMNGIVVGQGSALGEGFASFQSYARELSRRGIILAVCSKNDEANALEPFDKHPEMVLRRSDIACFIANWHDKASNIRRIAEELNIGLDSLVFVDDNPFERTLVREELPMVTVPEVPDDPALVPELLAAAGYFESVALTDEDHKRAAQYQENKARSTLRTSFTDLGGYLKSLDMKLVWSRFDEVGLQRIVQLINKTNQFNLTTKRYSEADVRAVMSDENAFGLQLRLLDRFGDNGIIAIIIGRIDAERDLTIDTWLMSCRVLGRQVEQATLNVLTSQANQLGADRVIGLYRPTAKNAMVRDHYEKLGFSVDQTVSDGSRSVLDLRAFTPLDTSITMMED